MDIIHPDIEKYLDSLTPAAAGVQQEMEEWAENEWFPIVGPQVGELLTLLTRISQAETVFEMGSGFGYSALFFARSLPDDGMVFCTDVKESYKKMAEEYFQKEGLSHKMTFLQGNSLELARSHHGTVDIVFNDIDKGDYPLTIDIAHDLLNPGGLFITDNSLWYGNFLRDNPDESSLAVEKFNSILMSDTRFHSSIIPMRDGVALAVKK